MEGVVAVGEHAIELGPVEDVWENLQRKTGHADAARLALLLHPAQGGQGLVDDLIEVAELDVVALDNVQIIEAHSLKAFVDTAGEAGGGEVELVHVVTATLRAEDEAVALDLL